MVAALGQEVTRLSLRIDSFVHTWLHVRMLNRGMGCELSRGGVGSGGRVSGVKFSKSASLDGFVTGGKPKAKYADGFTSIVAIKASASLQWPCFLVRCRVSTFEPFTRICRCLHCILHSRRGGRFMTTALTAAAAAAVVVAAVVVEAGARTVDLRVR